MPSFFVSNIDKHCCSEIPLLAWIAALKMSLITP